MKSSTAARALALVSGSFALAAAASDPATHDVAIPPAGQSVTVEWTGTALPGADGVGSTGNLTTLVGPDETVGCPPVGPDDAHTINLTGTVPDGATVQATFHIQWAGETSYGGLVGDPDLKLSVYDGTTLAGDSDGGNPEEEVTLTNPAAGAYKAIVCPFSSSQQTPYTARLTVTSVPPAACISGSAGKTLANAPSSGATWVNPEASGRPNFDRFLIETRNTVHDIPTDLHGRYQQAIYDRTFGVPTFLWARTDAPVAAVGALKGEDLLVARARAHLRNEAKVLHLSGAMIDQAQVFDAQFNGDGPAVVRFNQAVQGLPVFHRSLNVLLNREYRPVAVSGYFAQSDSPLGAYALGAPQAIAAAWGNLGGALDASALTPAQLRDGWQWYAKPAVTGSHVFERGPRARQVWYPRASGVEPAWQVELFARSRAGHQLIAYAFVVSALDGQVLYRENLKSEAAASYRVFADPASPIKHPYDSPLGNGYDPFPGRAPTDRLPRVNAGSSLITLNDAGIVTHDPWLPDDATTTTGNHVDVCLDLTDTAADGVLSTPLNSCDDPGDFRPAMTASRTFDYPIAADDNPADANAQGAAAVSLFYLNNWLHDWWYNHGFNEAAGNAQTSNYGRGGVEGDAIMAQGQDASGRNNANMSTPADGSSPVMQQYLFDGRPLGEVRVIAPQDSGPLVWVPAGFSKPSYDAIEADVALVNDGMGVSPSDACGEAVPVDGSPVAALPAAPDPTLAGKIALIDRGNCNFTSKAQYALASGAVALVVVQNTDGEPISMGNGDIPVAAAPASPTDAVYQQLPALMIRKADGDRIKALLASGAVTMHLERQASIDVDGTLDNQVVSHEYFHYVHHRLTSSSNQQADAMSEGWGDTDAIMLTVRAEDALVPGNDQFQGAYGLAGYVVNNFFAGIRRAPYTTDFTKNAFTFKHISDGTPTPDGGSGSGNSEVHNAGEIWANMMYECYAGVLDNPRNSFADAQSHMQDYIIGGLKMTPTDATYTEARDAILSVALASDFGDYTRCSHGFARRGNGLNAVAPSRDSTDLTGVVEDYTDFACPRIGPRAEGTSGGGGALAPGLLLPLLGFAALRRRRTKR